MATPKPFRMNRAAIRKIATSEELRLHLFTLADRMLQTCDPDGHLGEDAYVAVSEVTRNRARAAVVAVTGHARNSNALHHTLLNAIDSARD